jgi:hypothetical protein
MPSERQERSISVKAPSVSGEVTEEKIEELLNREGRRCGGYKR